MGMKKSEAKTNAAVRMIHLLRGEKFIQSVQPRHILTASLSPPSESASGSDKTGHQVTLLQEFCQKRKLWAPQYSYFQSGLTHGKGKNKQMEVTCVCNISALNLETRETRKSQKEARRAAADHMLNILYRNYPHDAFSY
jgi:dsRNA-specific ribonuclease